MRCASCGNALPAKILNFSSIKSVPPSYESAGRNLCSGKGFSSSALKLRPVRSSQSPTKLGHTPCAKAYCRGRLGLPETTGRIGAPALGFGIFQTPPNRYPPARLPQLQPGAKPGEYEPAEGADGRQPTRNRSRDDLPAGSSTERRNSIV